MNRSSRAPIERTTPRHRGAELDLSLVDVPRGRQSLTLADLLRRRIVDGTLQPGAHLPSSRQLAQDLGVSRGVIVSAYEQLGAEGHLESGRGSGTSVADRPDHALTSRPPKIEVPAVAGMNPGQPDPALFPRREWQRATEQALAELPSSALAYGDPRGHVPLRSSLRNYLGRARGILTDEDRIIITNGFAQCLSLVVQTLTRRDGHAVIAVEDPGSTGASAQLTWLGARIVPIRVDALGIDIAELRRCRARAVVVTPAHQYPTGVTLAAERRHQLVEWARSTDGIVVEDDYDAEYRYDRAPLTSLHALDAQHVIAAGSVSKSLSPALRLGWMVVPDQFVGELAAAKANADLGSSTLVQAALAAFIDNGSMDRHLRRTRTTYRQRRDRLIDALRARPDILVSGIAAGLHLVLTTSPRTDTDADALALRARNLGFAAQPLHRYRHRPGPTGLVLGYGSLPELTIPAAAGALIETISDC